LIHHVAQSRLIFRAAENWLGRQDSAGHDFLSRASTALGQSTKCLNLRPHAPQAPVPDDFSKYLSHNKIRVQVLINKEKFNIVTHRQKFF
jgi:hypothetical protein